jgi:hypothetical protein
VCLVYVAGNSRATAQQDLAACVVGHQGGLLLATVCVLLQVVCVVAWELCLLPWNSCSLRFAFQCSKMHAAHSLYGS